MTGSTTTEQTDKDIGQMPEIVVIAPRYLHEDDAWSGLMDTIVVTADRYHADDLYTEDFAADKSSHTSSTEIRLFQNGLNNHEQYQPFETDPNTGIFMYNQELYE